MFKPGEFLSFYYENLQRDLFIDHFRELINIIQKPIFHDIDNEDGSYFGKVGYLDNYVFNFFNKIWVPKNENQNDIYVVLSKQFPNMDFEFIAFAELEKLVEHLFESLGNDIYGNGHLSETEDIKDDVWIGRKWNTNVGSLCLIRLHGYFQLYYSYPN